MIQIKKVLMCFLMVFSTTMVMAQADVNPRYPFYNGKIEYKRPTAFNTIMGLAGALDTKGSHDVSTEDKDMTAALTKAVQAAGTRLYRLIVQQGEAPQDKTSEECYVLNATLSNVMSGKGKYGWTARADIELQLVNQQTGKEVARHKYGCAETFGQTPAAAAATVNWIATEKTVRFLTACLPLTGTVLQKGVEQLNGKVKDKQCYIDLGEKYGVYKKLKFIVYIDDNGKLDEIGEMKLKDTEGDDVGICTITSGNKQITEALQNGKKLIVKSNETLKDNYSL